jgi:hypothetical protein
MARAHHVQLAEQIVRARQRAIDQVRAEVGDEVDRASLDSFPASDPPSWNGVRLGSPREDAAQ